LIGGAFFHDLSVLAPDPPGSSRSFSRPTETIWKPAVADGPRLDTPVEVRVLKNPAKGRELGAFQSIRRSGHGGQK
jgi:hypothetical protein